MLFEFEDLSKAEKVFARGSRRIKENLLQLVRWTTEVGCLLKRAGGGWGRSGQGVVGKSVGPSFAFVELRGV